MRSHTTSLSIGALTLLALGATTWSCSSSSRNGAAIAPIGTSTETAPTTSAATGTPAVAPVDFVLDSSITRGPYVQNTTGTSATIVWSTSRPTSSTVGYGPSAAALGSTAGATTVSETEHAVTITGLQPGALYSYCVLVDGHPGTVPLGFATAAPPGATFTALVFGDSGTGIPQQYELADRMVGETFDLTLHTGDVIYPSGQAGGYDPYFFKPYGRFCATRPVFPAIGNHDMYDGQLGKPWDDVFSVPANNPQGSKHWYSFEWGDVKFISIDSFLAFRKPGPHQQWLEQELASNDRKWLVVFMHVPLYSVGYHGDDPQLQQEIGPVLEKYKVDLVLAGHDHLYERADGVKQFSQDTSWPGATHIVTGGAGAELYRQLTTHPTTRKVDSSFHYVLLTFSPASIHGKAARMDGSTIEEFDVVK